MQLPRKKIADGPFAGKLIVETSDGRIEVEGLAASILCIYTAIMQQTFLSSRHKDGVWLSNPIL